MVLFKTSCCMAHEDGRRCGAGAVVQTLGDIFQRIEGATLTVDRPCLKCPLFGWMAFALHCPCFRHGRQTVAVDVAHAFAEVFDLHAFDAPAETVNVAGVIDDHKIAAVSLCQDVTAFLNCGGEGLAAVGASPDFCQFGFQIRAVDAGALLGADLGKLWRARRPSAWSMFTVQ